MVKKFLASWGLTPPATLAWGSNMASMKPYAQTVTTLSKNGMQISGLLCPGIKDKKDIR